jgi:exopolysaccharide production protein ExoF
MNKRRLGKLAFALSLAVIVSAPVLAADYRLGVADKVKIKVQEWPDLSGEYTVTPDGSVSLPLIGNVNAAGLRLKEFAQQISERLKQRSEGSDQVLTAVEIAQFRPFSIMGDVQRPGQYPYRPGLTVLEAVTVAGGYYRPELGMLRLGREAVIATGEINTQQIKLNRLLVHEARLDATLAGREDVPLPPELLKLKDDPDISATLKSEQAALDLENGLKRNGRTAFETIKSLYENEITALRGQGKALAEEKESIGTQLTQLRSMAARGLALSPTMFALERSYAQVSNEQLSTETAVVRANENITLAEERARQLDQEKNRLDSKDLQQTRDAIAEGRAKLETATLLLHEAQTTAPAEAFELMTQDHEGRKFTIIRKDGDAIQQLAADETTSVAPDDIIKIPSGRSLPIVSSKNLSPRAELTVRQAR